MNAIPYKHIFIEIEVCRARARELENENPLASMVFRRHAKIMETLLEATVAANHWLYGEEETCLGCKLELVEELDSELGENE